MSETEYTLKIMVDCKANKVLFAEVGKDFVDFLFFLLELPLKTIKLLTDQKDSLLPCLGKIYESVQNFDESYLLSHQKKDTILGNVIRLPSGVDVPIVLEGKIIASQKRQQQQRQQKYCTCGYYYYNDQNLINGKNCPSCREPIIERGYVKDLVPYIVSDDLSVKPMTLQLSMSSLKSAKDPSATELREVKFGPEEVMKLLRAYLETKEVLTNIFIQNKRIKRERE